MGEHAVNAPNAGLDPGQMARQAARRAKLSEHKALSPEEELEELRDTFKQLSKRYTRLVHQHKTLEREARELRELALQPTGILSLVRLPASAFSPYIKFAVVWTFTALLLVVLAEAHFTTHTTPIAYGALIALGGLMFVLAIPATHILGKYLYGDEAYRFYQPFKGGFWYMVLQALSWIFYGLAIIALTVSIMYAHEDTTANGVLMGGGVMGILAQAFMVSSLLTFEPEPVQAEATGVARTPNGSPDSPAPPQARHVRKRSTIPKRPDENGRGTPQPAYSAPLQHLSV